MPVLRSAIRLEGTLQDLRRTRVQVRLRHRLLQMADQQVVLYHERKKRKRAAAGFFVTIVAIAHHIYYRRRIVELGDFSEEEEEIRIRRQMLRNIYMGPNLHCYDTLRFTKKSFFDLCAILRERAALKDTFYVTVEEAMTIVLLVLSHGMKFRLIRSTYRLTPEPISRHFNEVLGAILSLSHEIIKLPDPSIELPKDYKWKWFPNGLGALDGSHVDVRAPLHKQGRYRNRKKAITTNVLSVCDRNMKFVYVLAGWEGSASDGRVLRDAMFREDSFKIPNGKYYLVDAGYTNGLGFFAPFRNTRYHLKEWAANGNNPETPQELYNLRHAIARNVVERIWALLKMRWATLREQDFDEHYDIVNKMLSRSGFGWHDDKNMVTVEDDVWNTYVKANKDATSYMYKSIKFWDMISTLYSRDRATGVGTRTANKSAAKMAEENAITTANNKDVNSSTQADEDRPKKRYRSDDSIAVLGDKLDNFTFAFKADVPEPPPKPASTEEIWAVLDGIPDLENDQQLAIYDVLVADDRKFKSLVELPERMKKKWVIKQINT